VHASFRHGDSGTPAGSEIEIACDESGFTGGNLVGGQGRVFSHASVRLDLVAAGELVRDLRARIGAETVELKAGHLLRPKHRQVVGWLISPTSPLSGNAQVHLTDTVYFVLARLLDLLIGEEEVRGTAAPGLDHRTREMAVTLYDDGPRSYGTGLWQQFLTRAANVMRTNNRWLPKHPIESFFELVETMLEQREPTPTGRVLELVHDARPVAVATRAAYEENRRLTPLLEPVIPALARAVEFWGGYAESVSVVHDEQSALTPDRLNEIAATYAAGHPGRRLATVRLVDSKTDPRVQIADVVAGIARRIAQGQLDGSGDEFTALLRPYVDPQSTWADAQSWAALPPELR
jgi:hypothetical protein